MADDIAYRCIHADCGRALPREVAFCPYCGTRQKALAKAAAATPASSPLNTGQPAALQASPVAFEKAAPVQAAPAAAATAAPQVSAPKAEPPPLPPQQPSPPPPPPPLRREPRPGIRPGPKPIRMRTWLLILLVLAGLWMLAKPGRVDQKIENRVEQAVALTADCKLDEARKELATLKADSARPAQLRRLQSAITQATPGCDKKRQRGKAWSDTVDAIEKLLDGSSLEKASARLAAFMRRWGEAADTREARARIEAKRAERLLDEADACLKRRDRACARNRLEAAERVGAQGMEARLQTVREALARPAEADASSSRPQSRSGTGNGASRSSTATRESTVATDSVPPDGSFTSAEQVAQERERHRVQQVRNILADSNTDILKGNYQGAVERLRYCTGTVDPGNRSCAELRETAERMNRDMLRCVRDGGAWVNGACQ